MNKVLVSFVFNSPVLVPWKVVEGVENEELRETILLWQESKRESHRYKENEEVAEVDNPRQKMKVKRILRKKIGEGAEARHQLLGIECYWWQDPFRELPLSFYGFKNTSPVAEDE